MTNKTIVAQCKRLIGKARLAELDGIEKDIGVEVGTDTDTGAELLAAVKARRAKLTQYAAYTIVADEEEDVPSDIHRRYPGVRVEIKEHDQKAGGGPYATGPDVAVCAEITDNIEELRWQEVDEWCGPAVED